MKNSRPRILVVYPYPNIDTNPTMAFLLESLAKQGVEVEVLLQEGGRFLSPEPFGKTVRLTFVPDAYFYMQRASLKGVPKRVASWLCSPGRSSGYSGAADPAVFAAIRASRYSVIIGVDPLGITMADRLNRWAKRPLVYISFELLFADEAVSDFEEALKVLEREACGRTSLVLIQDEERADAFCRETSFPRDRIVMVPAAPPPQEVEKTDLLRKRLGISSDRRTVLYCGSVDPWSSRDELAELVSYWPEKFCLVLHSRSKPRKRVARYLAELTETGRVYLSSEPVGRRDLLELIASADFGLAPYKLVPNDWYTGANLYHLGLASGKVSCYAMCGLPILARWLPVFEREFASYRCGTVYRRMAETGQLLEEMDRDYHWYSQEARRFYRERLDPVAGMHSFCNKLMALAEVRTEAEIPERIVSRTEPAS